MQFGVPGIHNVVITPKGVRKEQIPNDRSPIQEKGERRDLFNMPAVDVQGFPFPLPLITLLSSRLAVEMRSTRDVTLTRDHVKCVRRSLPACPVVTSSMSRERSMTYMKLTGRTG